MHLEARCESWGRRAYHDLPGLLAARVHYDVARSSYQATAVACRGVSPETRLAHRSHRDDRCYGLNSMIQPLSTFLVQSRSPDIVQTMTPNIVQTMSPCIVQAKSPYVIQTMSPCMVETMSPDLKSLLKLGTLPAHGKRVQGP